MDKESYVRMSYDHDEQSEGGKAGPKLREHWSRTFATEGFGCFIQSVITCGIIHAVYSTNFDTIIQNVTTSSVGEFHFPIPLIFISVGVGLSYSVGLMVAPESQLNPAFTLAMCLGGVKPLNLLLPSVVGQLIGTVLGGLTVFASAHQLYGKDRTQFPFHTDMNYVQLFGFNPPVEGINNAMVLWNSMMFTALIICVIIPAVLKNPDNMPAVVGVVVTAFSGAQHALGVSNNPAMTFGGAIVCTIVGFPPDQIWGTHDGFLWAAFVGPLLGVILGVSIFRLYAYLVWEPPSK
jgi:glycerol uptake facilitator-like aquaporin